MPRHVVTIQSGPTAMTYRFEDPADLEQLASRIQADGRLKITGDYEVLAGASPRTMKGPIVLFAPHIIALV